MNPYQVLSAEFAHETNTFSRIPTDFARFEAQDCFLDGASAIAARGNSNTELAGFLDAARTHGWALQHVLSAIAQPAGRLTTDAFERLAGAIVAAAERAAGQLDGVALGLHGAMVAEGYDDGEGELLSRLRKVLGPRIPIAVTLDLHANVTRAMCEHANIIVSYRTYPHVDMRETAARAGAILQRAMAGEIRPVTLRAHLPMIDETNGGRTDVGDMLPRLKKARAYEDQPDVFAVSINAGFSRADISEIGPTVLVTAQGDLQGHAAFAQELADDIWACRHNLINRFLTVQEAAAECLAHEGGGRPIVVADYSDNPGGGAYGDATALLGALLDAGVKRACFGPVVDPQTVRDLQHVPLGTIVSVQLGGKTDSSLGGGPLALQGSLEHKSDGGYFAEGPMAGGLQRSWGPTVVLRVQDIDILVVSRAAQILDLAQFTAFGIDPRAKKVVALKSMQHFRAAFEPIASKVIVCDSSALCSPDPTRLSFTRVPRPLFPLDQDIDLAAWRRAQGITAHAAPSSSPSSGLEPEQAPMPEPAPVPAVPVPVPAQAQAQAQATAAAPIPPKKRPPRDAALGVLEQLAGWYPQLFGAVFRPLKRGIFQDLVLAHPDTLDTAGLKAALALHTRSTRYLTAVASGEKRHDLAGNAVEEMAPEHVFQALAEVFRRRQGRSSEDLAPRLRERIVQVFEASGLSREAYAELVRSRDEALNTLLDEALAEAAARGAKDEALLRAFDASGHSIEEFCDMYGMDLQVAQRSLGRARLRVAARVA